MLANGISQSHGCEKNMKFNSFPLKFPFLAFFENSLLNQSFPLNQQKSNAC